MAAPTVSPVPSNKRLALLAIFGYPRSTCQDNGVAPLRSHIVVASLVAALAMAPVAPEAGNILFLAAGAVAILLLRRVDVHVIGRPSVWMSLLGLVLLGLAYALASGAPGLAGLMFVVPLAATTLLIAAAQRSDLQPSLVGLLALCGVAGSAAIAIAEFATTGTQRVGIWVANPIHFADLSLSVAFLALIATLLGRGPDRWLFVVTPLLAAVAVLLSGTRGAVVALAIMGGTALITSVAVRMISLRNLAVGLVVLAIVLPAAWFAGVGQTSGVQRVLADVADVFRTGLPTDESTVLRLQMYEGGLNAFLASPLFGHGPFAFVEAAASRASTPFEGAPHLHNDLADFAASGGILGLAAYMLFLLAPLVEALKAPNTSRRAGLVVVSATLAVGYFVMGLTNAMFGILNLTVFYAVATLVVALLAQNVEQPERDRPDEASDGTPRSAPVP